MWTAVKTFPKRFPFATHMLLSSTLLPLADLNQQRELGQYDPNRSAQFVGFGLCQGVIWWWMYMSFFGKAFPHAMRFANASWADKLKDKLGQRDLVKQILFDNFIYPPILYFPVFYGLKEYTYHKTEGLDVTGMSIFSGAWNRYWSTWLEDNSLVWKVWILGDAICFAVPTWLRMPSTHAINWIFNSWISELRGKVDAAPSVAGTESTCELEAAVPGGLRGEPLGA